MSSNNPFKNFAATILDKSGSPILADKLVPDARKGCKHFENRARYFLTKGEDYGTLNGVITKDNFKDHFGKDFKEQHTYDKTNNTKLGPSLQGEMRD
ncbi:hypothetical protein N7G274_001225 [Stereocaulon virgatum]|uniref:Uncharacterized protein n=1 Tax=Stereocaulon virgatum TaxID=373712 RepID=A0ABR4AQY6_9LECA